MPKENKNPFEKYSDSQLEAELHRRRSERIRKELNETKCSYCGKFLNDSEPCPKNPFSDYHV